MMNIYDPQPERKVRDRDEFNIVVPMAGNDYLVDGPQAYPKQLVEINQKPLIELVLEPLKRLPFPKRFIFIVNESHCREFALDNVLKLAVADAGDSEMISLKNTTQGAACSVLLAIEHINNDNPLIIMNSDNVIEGDQAEIIENFRQRQLDVAVICFDSIHPRWSSVLLDENGSILEAAEKRPISRNAIAGFYYFRRGSAFVEAAMSMIRKGAVASDGQYYIAPCINELIIQGAATGIYSIPKEHYHNFQSVDQIHEYSARMRQIA